MAGLLRTVKLNVSRRLNDLSRATFSPSDLDSRLFVAQDWESFHNDPAFRHLLAVANRKKLFNKPHGIIRPEVAMAGN